MITREVHIDSYFTFPTDLAAEMAGWPEFVSGAEYSVHLRAAAERVEVGLVDRVEDEEHVRYVFIRGEGGGGELFHRAVGATVHAMAANSDSVWVFRVRHDT